MKRLLILGGTKEASQLAIKAATISNLEVRLSVAGLTTQARYQVGVTRVGGFGGVPGLIKYLQDDAIDILIDATHPFAAKISLHAAVAAKELDLPRLMLIRPEWLLQAGDNWLEVDSIINAAKILEENAKRVFLAVGRQQIIHFAYINNIWFLIRLIEPPKQDDLIPKGSVILDRGPFKLIKEKELLIEHQIDTIVSKNSGGDATVSKIIAARELGIKVVMVKRPQLPLGERVNNVEDALTWLLSLIKPTSY